MERLENRMVNESLWPDEPAEIKEKLVGPGYRGIGTDVFVPEDSAFDYALEHCAPDEPWRLRGIKWEQEFKEMLVEWFYSNSDWVKE